LPKIEDSSVERGGLEKGKGNRFIALSDQANFERRSFYVYF